ncbi:MAG: terpene cyclase/mutase family protein [Planctomycetales bacterium]|nr:terpene cyclase/mutase family protein [Planctomycetales bacterium]
MRTVKTLSHRAPLGLWIAGWCLIQSSAHGQVTPLNSPLANPSGDLVPREVREITEHGLQYLSRSQNELGTWADGYDGPGTTGLAMMAFLASGEDPNFGSYAQPIRKALKSIIRSQNSTTGYMGNSMYQHGFATLALAEAYGVVDETDLWLGDSEQGRQRSIGVALELAVRSAITSQATNPFNAWRYSPGSRDADTSVSGAVLMGLLAARNAGIEVPDKNIDNAIKYFSSMTSDGGSVGYSDGFGGSGQSIARSSIACLVFSIAKRKDLKQYESAKKYVVSNMNEKSHYEEYARYYEAQALFQADVDAWQKWNRITIRELKNSQNEDGSFSGQFGKATATSLNLLSLALNYKFLPIYER